jgi:orotate phosphoribosyltransferase
MISVHNAIIDLMPARRGHFLLESGHHGDLWLDLEVLCLRPRLLAQSVAALAAQLAPFEVEVVCGPLNEGAFVALLVAERMNVEFCYAERFVSPAAADLSPVAYRLPPLLRARVRGRRVAIVNDVTNAGSAVRGALADLRECGAIPVVIASLVLLAETMAQLAADEAMPLVSLATMDSQVWTPDECPLCAAGTSLEQL